MKVMGTLFQINNSHILKKEVHEISVDRKIMYFENNGAPALKTEKATQNTSAKLDEATTRKPGRDLEYYNPLLKLEDENYSRKKTGYLIASNQLMDRNGFNNYKIPSSISNYIRKEGVSYLYGYNKDINYLGISNNNPYKIQEQDHYFDGKFYAKTIISEIFVTDTCRVLLKKRIKLVKDEKTAKVKAIVYEERWIPSPTDRESGKIIAKNYRTYDKKIIAQCVPNFNPENTTIAQPPTPAPKDERLLKVAKK